MKKLKQIFPILVLGIMIITASFYAFHTVHAADGFHKKDTNWTGIANEMQNEKSSTYPYDGSVSSSKIKKVSLDVLYGTTRDLVTYHGEVPERETRTDDGEFVDAFEGIYARGETSLNANNPGGVSAYDYWGFTDSTGEIALDGDGNATLNDMQNVNSSDVVSLRLYALANTDNNWFSNITYVVGNFLAKLSTLVLSLLISAKNIDMDTIMNTLNLSTLSDFLTKNFIYDSDNIKLSAFTGFAIIMFIFALVAYVIRYVKGADKTRGLWDLVGTALIGLFIIGMCLSGRVHSLGSVVSDIASDLMYTAAASLNSTGTGKAFEIEIEDDVNSNKILQMQEMCLINKSFIELQLCTQFGVSKVSELKFTALGDTNNTIAKNTLAGIDNNIALNDNFNGNLGYYYWFANSSAVKKTKFNKSYPTTNTVAAKDKLNSMVTYLQKIYNKARTTNTAAAEEDEEAIKNIMLSISNPSGAKGFLVMFLFTVILILLAICLFKYGLNVMIGKLELFISLLGLAVAGPLMVTTNKKLVKTGKTILGMIIVSFINITVYSIIFDIILYFIASMISTDPIELLIVLFVVILLYKFNPIIQEKIKQILEANERNISPALADGKRAIKNYTRQKANEYIGRYDRSNKIVGYDENGEAIRQQRQGDALSKLLHHGYNATYNDGMQRQGFLKINSEMNSALEKNNKQSAQKKRAAAERSVDNVYKEIQTDASRLQRQVESTQSKLSKECYEYDAEDKVIGYNEENLTSDEQERVAKINERLSEIENIQALSRYKELCEEKAKIDEHNSKLKEGEDKKEFTGAAELAGMNMKIQASRKAAQTEKAALDKAIKQRTTEKAFEQHDLDYHSADGSTNEEKLKNATTLQSQEMHKDKLRSSLLSQIEVASSEADTMTTGKIGATKKSVNRDAIISQATAEMQLADVDNGRIVSDRQTARKDAENIARAIEASEIKSSSSKKIESAEQEIKSAVKIKDKETRNDSIKKGVQHLNEARIEHAQDIADGRQRTSNITRENMSNVLSSENVSDFARNVDTTMHSKNVSQQVSYMVRQKELAKVTGATAAATANATGSGHTGTNMPNPSQTRNNSAPQRNNTANGPTRNEQSTRNSAEETARQTEQREVKPVKQKVFIEKDPMKMRKAEKETDEKIIKARIEAAEKENKTKTDYEREESERETGFTHAKEGHKSYVEDEIKSQSDADFWSKRQRP